MIIEELTTSNSTYRLKEDISDLFDEDRNEIGNIKGAILMPVTTLPKKGTTVVTQISKGKMQGKVVFGTMAGVNLEENYALINHFIPKSTVYEKDLVLQKCGGCVLGINNADIFKNECRGKCIIVESAMETFRLSPNKWQSNYQHSLGYNSYHYKGISEAFIATNIQYNDLFSKGLLNSCLDNSLLYVQEVHETITNRDILQQVLRKHSRYNISCQRIRRIKERISAYKSSLIKFYIDASVRYAASENIIAIFGIMIYDQDNNLVDSYFSTIEHWITSVKAETMAFLVSLLMIPDNKHVQIFTDCQTVVTNYEILANPRIVTSTRDILKFSHNNSIWFTIKDVLATITTTLEVFKVMAHSADQLHNLVDIEIKEWYNNDINLANTLIKNFSQSYQFPITWNNYVIEMNLRKFIRLTTRVEALEKFFNLNRNWRYRYLEVNWSIVFNYINHQLEGENTFTTNAANSKQKRKRVQRLIEELPTIEQLKKSSYDLYRSFLCVYCKRKKEDFVHVWNCRNNRKRMKKIIKDTTKKLMDLILETNKELSEEHLALITNHDVFDFKFTDRKFNFIDLIKGIFPLRLYDDILTILGKNQTQKANEIGVEVLKFVYEETTKNIWLPRCDEMKKLEKLKKITKQDKKLPDSRYLQEKQEEILQRPQILDRRFYGLEGIKEFILFGKEILGFTINVNRVGKKN